MPAESPMEPTILVPDPEGGGFVQMTRAESMIVGPGIDDRCIVDYKHEPTPEWRRFGPNEWSLTMQRPRDMVLGAAAADVIAAFDEAMSRGYCDEIRWANFREATDDLRALREATR